MRWLVDDVAETELWTGLGEEKTREALPQPLPRSEEDQGERLSPPPQATTESVTSAEVAERLRPARDRITLVHTLTLGNAGGPRKLVGLLPGMMWTALVTIAGLWVAGRLVEGGAKWTAVGLHDLVVELAQQRPVSLAVIFFTVVVLAAVGLSRPLRMITRAVAVRAVYEQEFSLIGQTLPFAQRSGNQGLVSVWLLTAAGVLYLAGLPLGLLVVRDSSHWPELACLWGAALLLGAVGALGLGAVAVDGRRLEEKATSPLGNYVANGAELLGSALCSLGMGMLRAVVLFCMVWLSWFFVSESLGWVEKNNWSRWGLDGRVIPEVDGPLYWFASRVAGLWFFLLFSTVLMYPLSYLLRWGVICYLRARQQTEEPPAEPLDLDDEERSDLLEGQKRRKGAKKD